MSVCAHRIRITNYTDAAAISPTSIILLRGFVQHQPNSSCSNDSICIKNASTDTSHIFDISRKSNEFKALLRLQLGPNQLTITSKCFNASSSSHTITITYEPPINNPYVVRFLYIICKDHDGRFQSPIEAYDDCQPEDACRKIQIAAELAQCIFAEKLYERGLLPRRTFRIAAEGVSPFYSEMSYSVARGLSNTQLWTEFAKEIIAKVRLQNDFVKYVAFLDCSLKFFDDDDDGLSSFSKGNNQRSMVAGGVKLAVGDLALFGTRCLYTWPSCLDDVIGHFKDERAVDVSTDESNGRGTFGGCWSSNLGSLCHEIGHIFGLGHTQGGLMGEDVDYVSRMFVVDHRTICVPGRVVDTSLSTDGACDINKQMLDTRLTNVKRNNNVRFLKSYHAQKDQQDLTYFTESSAIILFTHRWLSGLTPAKSNRIEYSENTQLVTSESLALRVIEIRKKPNALLQKSFIFEASQDVRSFVVSDELNLHGFDVFAMDVEGNYCTFSIEQLSNHRK